MNQPGPPHGRPNPSSSPAHGPPPPPFPGPVFAGYAHLYGPLAVCAFAIPFTTLFESVTRDGITTTYPTLWETTARSGGGPATLGILFMLALVSLMLAAVFLPPKNALLPSGIAALAAIEVLMLLTKPGTGTPAPPLSESGTIALALGFGIVVLGTVHAVHVTRAARSLPR